MANSPRSINAAAIGAGIIAVVLITYLPALRAGFIWDDDLYVTKNTMLHDCAGLKRIWFEIGATPQYYPLVFTTFWVERRIWGIEQPAGYHLTNVLLHAANALLVWLVLKRLKIPGALLGALFFAVHPVHVESVAWIAERKNVLSGLFYLSALLAYLRFCRIDHESRPGSADWKFYFVSVALFICALLSKTVTCTLPATLALILWWKCRSSQWRNFAPLLPMFLIALPAARLTASVEAQHVGAHGPDWNFSILERLLIAGRAVWFYTCSIVAPANLTFIYPRWHIDPSQWWQYLYPIGVIGVVVTLWMKRHRWGKGPLVGCLYFIGTLAPALGFVNVYPMLFSFVADHFQYLASIGALALTAAAAAKISVSWPHAARVALTAGMMIVLIAISWAQESKYKDAESLWTDTIRKNPGAWIAHNNLSEPLLARGDFDGAAEHALMALELRPNYPPAHNNLGLAFQGLKRNEDAVQEFRRAIELDPTMPQARLNLAEQLINQNDLDAAEHEYTEAIRLAPDFADAHYNYAVLLAMRRRRDEALREAHIACKLNPDDAQSALLLGKLEGTNP